MKKIFQICVLFIFLLSMLIQPIYTTAATVSTTSPKVEMRAAWIATVQNVDMKRGMSKTSYTTWVKKTLDQLKADKFNAVIYQVKPTSDAFYPSKYAPWSRYLTGKKQGTNPGYDPLKIMITEAHKRGMELHAWVNPYRVTMPGETLSSLASNNVAKKNPSWVVKYGKQYYLNPGLPQVQNYLINTVKELVTKYDIDAIHMDDYFYPYKIPKQDFPDKSTYKKYGKNFKKIADWRRENVNQLIRKLYSTIKEIKPGVQFGISPFGVWRNVSLDPTGSKTRAGVNNYDDLYADTRQWIKEGTIDYITPQIYWSRSFSAANYSVLLDWWTKEVTTYALVHPVNLYIGMADYKVNNDSDKAWKNKSELSNQIIANRTNTISLGQMHFSTRNIQKNALGYKTLMKKNLYNYTAVTPSISWSDATIPQKPTDVQAALTTNNIKLTIKDNNLMQPKKYIVYRVSSGESIALDNPLQIVDVVYNTKGSTTFIDTSAIKNETYTYALTAVSATGVESVDATLVAISK